MSEDFNTKWKNNDYVILEDWTNLKKKFVQMKNGVKGIGVVLEKTQTEMNEGLEEVMHLLSTFLIKQAYKAYKSRLNTIA